MKHFHYTEVKSEDIPSPANKVKVRWLIDEKTGAPNFALRRFEVAPGGYTPYHKHLWEHEIYVLKGKALATKDDGSEVPLQTGDVVLVEPNEKHNFKNASDEEFVFICLIPLQK